MNALRFAISHNLPPSRPRKAGGERGKRVAPSGKTPKKRVRITKKLGMPRILLVDDKPEVRQVLRSILEGESFVCVEAENGAEALQCLDAKTFSLVITDIKMPVMDGFQFLKRLGQKSLAERPPVIVLSGSQDDAGRDLARKVGAVAALTKPCNLGELLSAVTTALKNDPSVPEH